MAKKKLRVGVVGLGMGKGHLGDYLKNDHCQVAAICDLNTERLEQTADEHHIELRYTDAKKMFAQAHLDAVSIATPNKFHCPLTLAALKKGIHVLCEKPMAMNVTDAKKMKAAAEKAGKNLMINLSCRFLDMSLALKQQVDAGVIGDIYFGKTIWHRRRGAPNRPSGTFTDKNLAGGGPLIDLGVHRIDLALWLMGHPEPVSVYGSTYDILGKKFAKEKDIVFTVEDLAAGIVKFDNGATLIVENSWILNINEKEQMLTALYGDKGGIVQKNVDGAYQMTAEIYTEEAGNLYTKTLDQACVPSPTSYQEFIASIVEKRQPQANADQGIKVQKILDGLYKSAKTGREVRF